MAYIYRETLEDLRKEVKKRLPEIEKNGEWLLHHPETGFREHETQAYCLDILKKHGFEVKTFPNTTGYTCTYDTGKPGPCIMIMGEIDALINKDHPDANPKTGAAHACGHFIQTAVTMGAFLTLVESGIMSKFNGKLMLMGVPAEECVEQEWRLNEIKEGRLHYLGGKPELMYHGAFDDADLVIGMHAGIGNDGTITTFGSHNGFVAKSVIFKGKAAHAAGHPDQGINALYMVNTALTALNGIRETFRDEDTVRVHPIVTSAGSVPNVIPAEAHIETQCRAGTMEAVYDAANKFDRAMGAGAYAFGGKVLIQTQPGYLPYHPTPEFDKIAVEVADDILGPNHGQIGKHNNGSEDLGDLSTVKPCMMAFVNYMHGLHHQADYYIADKKIYETSTLFLAALACRLLDNNGELVKVIQKAYKPQFSSVKEYCETVNKLFSEKVLP
jgi:amidohydrolase